MGLGVPTLLTTDKVPGAPLFPRHRAGGHHRDPSTRWRGRGLQGQAALLHPAGAEAPALHVNEALLERFELHTRRELPRVFRAVDADVLDAGLHTEGMEQAMVVVGGAVTFVNGNVELVSTFDKVE